MKTLIVHPKDNSTTFLDVIYKDIPDQTLITGGITKTELKELIKSHDRVMMMGHGSPNGLFSVGQFSPDDIAIEEANNHLDVASLLVGAPVAVCHFHFLICYLLLNQNTQLL